MKHKHFCVKYIMEDDGNALFCTLEEPIRYFNRSFDGKCITLTIKVITAKMTIWPVSRLYLMSIRRAGSTMRMAIVNLKASGPFYHLGISKRILPKRLKKSIRR